MGYTITPHPANCKIMGYEELWRKVPDNKIINAVHSLITSSKYRVVDHVNLHICRASFLYEKAYGKSPTVMAYIPSYNRIEYLIERSIPSILSQTYPNIRILIVDDGSTDGTPEKLKQHFGNKIEVRTIDRKKYRYPNKSIYHWYSGPVEAANYALSLCSEDWIARLDDDDEWSPDHIETSIRYALTNRLEFVSSTYKRIQYDGQGVSQEDLIGDDDNMIVGGTQTWLYHGGLRRFKYNIHSWRKSWNRVNDTDLQARFIQAGVKIGKHNGIGCVIKPRANEMKVGSSAYMENEAYYERFYGLRGAK